VTPRPASHVNVWLLPASVDPEAGLVSRAGAVGGGGGVDDENPSAQPARHARSGLSGPKVAQYAFADPMNGHR